eukprot:gene3691-13759_t
MGPPAFMLAGPVIEVPPRVKEPQAVAEPVAEYIDTSAPGHLQDTPVKEPDAVAEPVAE